MSHTAHDRILRTLRAAGATHVVVLALEGAPAACCAADGTTYPLERAIRERPLPHSPACACLYAPRSEAAETPAAPEIDGAGLRQAYPLDASSKSLSRRRRLARNGT